VPVTALYPGQTRAGEENSWYNIRTNDGSYPLLYMRATTAKTCDKRETGEEKMDTDAWGGQAGGGVGGHYRADVGLRMVVGVDGTGRNM
jgi:hypothetical protein